MSVLCMLGFHKWRVLIGEWAFSRCVHKGTDAQWDPDGMDEDQYLHLSVCDRDGCGRVMAYVDTYHLQGLNTLGLDFHREAKFEEVVAALEENDRLFLLQNRRAIEKQYRVDMTLKDLEDRI